MNVMIRKIQRRIDAYEHTLKSMLMESELKKITAEVVNELYYLLDWYERKGKREENEK
jgi:hypothetical protein